MSIYYFTTLHLQWSQISLLNPPFEHNTGELDTSFIKLEQIYRAGVAWCDGQSQLPQNGDRQDSKSLAVVVLPEPD